jgi:hypothetical protein
MHFGHCITIWPGCQSPRSAFAPASVLLKFGRFETLFAVLVVEYFPFAVLLDRDVILGEHFGDGYFPTPNELD